jgi:hypothetical protein
MAQCSHVQRDVRAALTRPRPSICRSQRQRLAPRPLHAAPPGDPATPPANPPATPPTTIDLPPDTPDPLDPPPEGITRYRTIWLSDIHLGTPGCQAEYLLDFLRHNESDYLYLVGDIIDGWQLRKGWYWPQAHNDVVQKMLRKARKGTEVIYVPGNHDEAARQFDGLAFGDITVRGTRST